MPVTCPRCCHDNPDISRFCGGCGARLEAICAACETANPAANRFCHQCGATTPPRHHAVTQGPRAIAMATLTLRVPRTRQCRLSGRNWPDHLILTAGFPAASRPKGPLSFLCAHRRQHERPPAAVAPSMGPTLVT